MMPLLKFETKVIDGKANISFDTENIKTMSKKKIYKGKNQGYPLRNYRVIDHLQNDNQTKNSQQNNYENELFSRKKPTEFINKTLRPNDINPVPDQNVKAKANTNTNVNHRKIVKPTVGKESLFNFLEKDKTTEKHENQQYTDEEDMLENQKSRKKSLTESDIDEIMKQVVMENKHLLTEEQLVDILAKLYLNARGGGGSKKTKPDHKFLEPNEKPSNEKIIDLPKKEEMPKIDLKSSEPQESNRLFHSNAAIPLTAMQKKQLQWEKERREMAEIASYNPWGRPGCGAPTKNPMEVPKNDSVYLPKESPRTQRDRIPDPFIHSNSKHEGISLSEQKRQQWLIDLNNQVSENESRKMMEKDSIKPSDNFHVKINSAGATSPNHGRGKGLADLSQMSNEELIQKRTKQLEQQESIRRQIEEKESQKRLDREKKAYLDQQEEARIMREKQQIDTQYLSETARIKQKDVESGMRLAQQRNQLEAAEKAALMDKKLKRLQRLEMSGHDTRQLRAGLIAEQMSGRLADSIDIRSDDNSYSRLNMNKGLDRLYTNRSPGGYMRYPDTEDHAVQTDNCFGNERETRRRDSDEYDRYARQKSQRIQTSDIPKPDKKYHQSANVDGNRKSMKNNSARKRSSSSTPVKLQLTRKTKKPEPIDSRRPWGAKKVAKQYVPQSKRDPFYSTSQETRENHKHERVSKILAQVRANLDRIPDKEVSDGRLSQRHKTCDTQRRYDNDKENYEVSRDTYDLKNNSRLMLVDDDRVHASATYKDTYKVPTKLNQTYCQLSDVHETKRSMASPTDWWDDSNHAIVRTTDILNPAMADQRLPLSRENTGREKARQGYYKSLNPAQYGEPLNLHQDNFYLNNKESNKIDPFFQPQPHPTQRQNTILKQLSEFREGLLMKQKEIETSLSMNDDQ